MGEIGSARNNIFNDKSKKRVLMCILNPYVSNRTHRFPKYVTSAVAPLDTLQTQMTSGPLPEVSPRQHKDRSCIHISGVVAHSHHDQDVHASPRRARGLTTTECQHRGPEPSKVEARLESRDGVRVVSDASEPIVDLTLLRLTKALVSVNKGLSALPEDVQKKYNDFLKILQVCLQLVLL